MAKISEYMLVGIFLFTLYVRYCENIKTSLQEYCWPVCEQANIPASRRVYFLRFYLSENVSIWLETVPFKPVKIIKFLIF